MSVYLDASILVALLNTEDSSAAVLKFLNASKGALIVSDFASGEVSSAISRLVRMDKLDAAAATERLAAFDEWAATATRRLATGENDIRLAGQLVRRFHLGVRMPDAIHLASAQINGFVLATLDRRMAMNAEQLRLSFVVPGMGEN